MNTTQRDALYLAEYLEKFRSFPEDIAAATELRRQHARIEQLEKSESDLIAERDCRDEIIDRMADAVLGAVRTEWSSSYDLIDAAQEVEDFMMQAGVIIGRVDKLKAEVEKLQQQLIAEAKKTAEEKLRADKLDKQHTMQSRMHAEAVQRIQQGLEQFIEQVGDVHFQRCRVGSKEGAIRWDIEFGYYGAEVRGKTLQDAITKAIAAQTKKGEQSND